MSSYHYFMLLFLSFFIHCTSLFMIINMQRSLTCRY